MSYFVRRHCPYFVHFVRLKIKRTNLWGLPLGAPIELEFNGSYEASLVVL